ncbi:MAG: hypothetical protein LM564_01135 [Desulfurococcaceae archaeon]|jgi:hypothetical protein|nr:hypothetical protein [Desulfurococcaceae archaeon]
MKLLAPARVAKVLGLRSLVSRGYTTAGAPTEIYALADEVGVRVDVEYDKLAGRLRTDGRYYESK